MNIPANILNYKFYGYVRAADGEALPGATVTVTDAAGGFQGASLTNATGFYSIQVKPGSGAWLSFSHVGYKPVKIPAYLYKPGNAVDLERNYKLLPAVTVTATKPPAKKFPVWLALLPLAVIAADKKKGSKLSGIKPGDAMTGLIIVGGVLGFNVVSRILETLGLKDTKATADLNKAAEMENSKNPWSPAFWKAGPPGTLLMTYASARDKAIIIKHAFGLIDDNEEAVFNIFRQLKTQSQLSFLADIFQQGYKQDLFTFLRGGSWWQVGADRLSDAELARLNQMVFKLPKYTL